MIREGDLKLNIELLLNRSNEVKSKIEELRTEKMIQDRIRDTHLASIEKFNLDKEEKLAAIEVLDKSIKIFQKVSDERNKTAKDALETVVNWALSKIFTDPTQSFELKIEEHNNAQSGKTMELSLMDLNTGYSKSLKDQQGNAMAQIVSFLMLLTVIKFSDTSKVLVLDEMFSGLEDNEAVRMLSDVLVSLAKNDGFQIFLTEQNSLISDNEDFVRVNVALEDMEEGLKVKRIDKN